MLIKEIINGISQKIYSFYEGLYDIYVEDVEQGLEVPCFMINLISSNIRMILKPRYMFESVFDVIYFGEGYKDCMDRGSELYDILEYITINDKDEACKYCSLKNICFVKEEDRRYLYIEEDEEEDD